MGILILTLFVWHFFYYLEHKRLVQVEWCDLIDQKPVSAVEGQLEPDQKA